MTDVPVYLFTGFLESGKTGLIKTTLQDEQFCAGERTLVICCEEGIEEYEAAVLQKANAVLVTVDSFDELNETQLQAWQDQYQPQQVMVEYNGTWSVTEFLDLVFPIDWVIVQIIATVDAGTFANYITNMRSLMYEQLVHCELIIMNRCDESTKKSFLRGNVKAINRTAQIIYEDVDGNVNELSEDELPFDKNADTLVIDDNDYGLWYMDASEHPDQYTGKTVTVKGRMYPAEQWGKPVIIVGRRAMVCCEQDTSMIGIVVSNLKRDGIEAGQWAIVTGKMKTQWDDETQMYYMMMEGISYRLCEAMDDEFVYFS